MDPLMEKAQQKAKELHHLRMIAIADQEARPPTQLSIEMCELLVGFICQLTIEPVASVYIDKDLVDVSGQVPRDAVEAFIELAAMLGAGIRIEANGTVTRVEASQAVDSNTVSFAQRLAEVAATVDELDPAARSAVAQIVQALQKSFDETGLDLDLKAVTAVMLGATINDVAERSTLMGSLSGDPAPHELVTAACAVIAAWLLGTDTET